MTVESEYEIEALKRIGQVVKFVLQSMLDSIEPGMSTGDLDAIGARLLAEQGARSAPQCTYNFPGATCISVNEEVAHGIPGSRVIQKGDVVNVDVSAELDGFYADTGGTHVVPPVSKLKHRLCAATQEALQAAMQEASAGSPLNYIGRAIQRVADKHRFHTIKNLGSHGIGRALHEPPESIPGYYEPRDKRILQEGMVITIEPFLSTKATFVKEANDGWTLLGPKGNLSAQFEHTMIITKGHPTLLT